MVKHPAFEGVFLKHFFAGDETGGRLNNLEVHIVPGFEITPHVHEQAGEYFYVVEGSGEFLGGGSDAERGTGGVGEGGSVGRGEWRHIEKGDAFQAPQGTVHAIKNTGREMLVLFSTFSPPVR